MVDRRRGGPLGQRIDLVRDPRTRETDGADGASPHTVAVMKVVHTAAAAARAACSPVAAC